jgi:hypothetical protein
MPAAESAVPLGAHLELASDGVLLILDDAALASDREQVRAGLEAVRSYLGREGALIPGLVCVDVRVTQSSLAGSANALGNRVVIYTTPEGWTLPLSWHLSLVAAHEYVHAWQYHASGDAPPGGPIWLVEGAAQFIAVRSIIEAGILPHAEAQSLMTRPSGPLVPALRDLEAPESFDVINVPYDLAYAAVDLLTSLKGVAGLQEYWTDVGSGVAWQTAFERAFGLTALEFYELFEQSSIPGFGFRPH